jgi:hypothetical protein
MNGLTTLCLRPILRLLPRSTRSDSHLGLPGALPAGRTLSTPLDRWSIVPPCAVCIEAGRATEATHQTRDHLCGCDKHIQELEQHGRAAVRDNDAPRYADNEAQNRMDMGIVEYHLRAERLATDRQTCTTRAVVWATGVLAPATIALVVVT